MPKRKMDEDAQERLQKALVYAGDDLKKVKYGVREALREIRDRARYVYLFYLLQRQARARIRADKKKAQKAKKTSFSPGAFLDAYRHEQDLVEGIPQHDL